MKHDYYPEVITGLPEADIPFKGVRGWLSQGADHQVVFFDIQAIGQVPEHAHGAQWGTVFEGEMQLNIGGEVRTYTKGDSYYIPPGVLHGAVFNQRTFLMDFFADADRYQPKT